MSSTDAAAGATPSPSTSPTAPPALWPAHFVSNDQIGFVPNTFIAESTLLINMIQAHLNSPRRRHTVLIFLTLKKLLIDAHAWKYLRQAISALRTTKNYKDRINLLYDDWVP
eukprot:6194963-Pleurochrysis_carterae.AAC.5